VLIDVIGPEDIPARGWSLWALKRAFSDGPIVFSAIVWAELAVTQEQEQILTQAFAWLQPEQEDFPFTAARLAGAAHREYRRAGGRRERTLPDFLIGAHALVAGHALLTRDAARYRTYFPRLPIIAPDTHP